MTSLNLSLRTFRTPVRSPRAFTLVELVVVLGIVALLITVLVVVVAGARETARGAQTQVTMSSMSQGVAAFRQDTGYLPPLLDESRGLMEPPPLDDGNVFERLQGWYSITSPAEYLLGYGHHGEDGFGWDRDDDYAREFRPPTRVDETQRFGIRHPGFDGVWTATLANSNKGLLAGRYERFVAGKVDDTGPVLGPYLDLPSGTVGALAWAHHDEDAGLQDDDDHHEGPGEWDETGINPVTGQPQVFFPGEAGYDRHGARVICDAWGNPIRFYRRAYPRGSLSRTFPANQQPFSPRLSQHIALRPWEFDPGTATDFYVPMGSTLWGDYNSTLDTEGRRGDSSTTYELQSGEYAFLSAGRDGRINNWQRTDFLGIGGNDGTQFMDDWHYKWEGIPNTPQYPVPETEEVNRDNLVEIGS